MAIGLLLVALLAVSVQSHQHHFADHPEWNDIWPEAEPVHDLQALSKTNCTVWSIDR
jgi:hypothetical protein